MARALTLTVHRPAPPRRPLGPLVVGLVVGLMGCGSTDPNGPATRDPGHASGAADSPPQGRAEDAPPPEQPGPPPAAWGAELTLTNAAFETGGAPSVVVHAPPAFRSERPLRLVVFLHGWSGCVRVLAHSGDVACAPGERPREGWGLLDTFDATGSDALFVLPQLALMERDGSPGRFTEPDRFRAFLRELLSRLEARLGPRTVDEIESVTLLAHSAGFESALAILSRGGVEVRHVVLFDALYRGVEPFAQWARADASRRLVSLFTGTARTATQSRRLALRGRQLLGVESVAYEDDSPLADQVRGHRLIVARSSAPHALVPARSMGALLEPLGLGSREVH